MLIKPLTIDQQESVVHSFWMMLRECENHAEANDDVVLKRWVEGWYRQWNAMTGQDLQPKWPVKPEPVSAIWLDSQ